MSRLCQDLDAEVERFRTRRLGDHTQYVWLDATFVKVREQGRVVAQAVVLATGAKASGERKVLGLDVGPSEDGTFLMFAAIGGEQIPPVHAGRRAIWGPGTTLPPT